MTYLQIFSEIYRKKKRFILAYVTFCLIFSIFAFGNGYSVFADSDITTTQIINTLGGSGGKLLAPLTLAQGCLSGIDASSTMMILCVASFALDYIPESTLITFGDALEIEGLEALSTYSFGILDFNAFRIFCLVWFIVDKLAKSNGVSQEVAKIFGDFESLLTIIVNVMVIGSQFLANVPLGATAYAASFDLESIKAVTHGFNALICFILLMLVSVIYFFTRYFFYFIDIALLPVCSLVPLSSFGVESIKTVSVSCLFCLVIFNPVVFCAILALILIISIIFFRKAYISIRYFKSIYVKPFFRKIIGYRRNMPLIKSNYPKKIKHYVNESELQIVIPVYLVKKVPGAKATRSHDRWWFVSTKDKQFLCKPCLFRNSSYCIDLHNGTREKMFIKKSFRFFEVFNLHNQEADMGKTFHRIPKNVHFVFSKEYLYRFDQIKEITLFTDYTEYRKEMRQTAKLNHLERRLERKEAAEDRRLARQKYKVHI